DYLCGAHHGTGSDFVYVF
nr:immunoglobulin light chain junction region [Macaca mulatta]